MNVYTRLPQKELDATKMSMATGHVTIKSINIMRTQQKNTAYSFLTWLAITTAEKPR